MDSLPPLDLSSTTESAISLDLGDELNSADGLDGLHSADAAEMTEIITSCLKDVDCSKVDAVDAPSLEMEHLSINDEDYHELMEERRRQRPSTSSLSVEEDVKIAEREKEIDLTKDQQQLSRGNVVKEGSILSQIRKQSENKKKAADENTRDVYAEDASSPYCNKKNNDAIQNLDIDSDLDDITKIISSSNTGDKNDEKLMKKLNQSVNSSVDDVINGGLQTIPSPRSKGGNNEINKRQTDKLSPSCNQFDDKQMCGSEMHVLELDNEFDAASPSGSVASDSGLRDRGSSNRNKSNKFSSASTPLRRILPKSCASTSSVSTNITGVEPTSKPCLEETIPSVVHDAINQEVVIDGPHPHQHLQHRQQPYVLPLHKVLQPSQPLMMNHQPPRQPTLHPASSSLQAQTLTSSGLTIQTQQHFLGNGGGGGGGITTNSQNTAGFLPQHNQQQRQQQQPLSSAMPTTTNTATTMSQLNYIQHPNNQGIERQQQSYAYNSNCNTGLAISHSNNNINSNNGLLERTLPARLHSENLQPQMCMELAQQNMQQHQHQQQQQHFVQQPGYTSPHQNISISQQQQQQQQQILNQATQLQQMVPIPYPNSPQLVSSSSTATATALSQITPQQHPIIPSQQLLQQQLQQQQLQQQQQLLQQQLLQQQPPQQLSAAMPLDNLYPSVQHQLKLSKLNTTKNKPPKRLVNHHQPGSEKIHTTTTTTAKVHKGGGSGGVGVGVSHPGSNGSGSSVSNGKLLPTTLMTPLQSDYNNHRVVTTMTSPQQIKYPLANTINAEMTTAIFNNNNNNNNDDNIISNDELSREIEERQRILLQNSASAAAATVATPNSNAISISQGGNLGEILFCESEIGQTQNGHRLLQTGEVGMGVVGVQNVGGQTETGCSNNNNNMMIHQLQQGQVPIQQIQLQAQTTPCYSQTGAEAFAAKDSTGFDDLDLSGDFDLDLNAYLGVNMTGQDIDKVGGGGGSNGNRVNSGSLEKYLNCGNDINVGDYQNGDVYTGLQGGMKKSSKKSLATSSKMGNNNHHRQQHLPREEGGVDIQAWITNGMTTTARTQQEYGNNNSNANHYNINNNNSNNNNSFLKTNLTANNSKLSHIHALPHGNANDIPLEQLMHALNQQKVDLNNEQEISMNIKTTTSSNNNQRSPLHNHNVSQGRANIPVTHTAVINNIPTNAFPDVAMASVLSNNNSLDYNHQNSRVSDVSMPSAEGNNSFNNLSRDDSNLNNFGSKQHQHLHQQQPQQQQQQLQHLQFNSDFNTTPNMLVGGSLAAATSTTGDHKSQTYKDKNIGSCFPQQQQQQQQQQPSSNHRHNHSPSKSNPKPPSNSKTATSNKQHIQLSTASPLPSPSPSQSSESSGHKKKRGKKQRQSLSMDSVADWVSGGSYSSFSPSSSTSLSQGIIAQQEPTSRQHHLHDLQLPSPQTSRQSHLQQQRHHHHQHGYDNDRHQLQQSTRHDMYTIPDGTQAATSTLNDFEMNSQSQNSPVRHQQRHQNHLPHHHLHQQQQLQQQQQQNLPIQNYNTTGMNVNMADRSDPLLSQQHAISHRNLVGSNPNLANSSHNQQLQLQQQQHQPYNPQINSYPLIPRGGSSPPNQAIVKKHHSKEETSQVFNTKTTTSSSSPSTSSSNLTKNPRNADDHYNQPNPNNPISSPLNTKWNSGNLPMTKLNVSLPASNSNTEATSIALAEGASASNNESLALLSPTENSDEYVYHSKELELPSGDSMIEGNSDLYSIGSSNSSLEVKKRWFESLGVDEEEETPLHCLCDMPHEPALYKKIKDNKNFQKVIDLHNNQQQTALFVAVAKQKPKVVQFLVESGADVNIICKSDPKSSKNRTSIEFQTALHEAVECGNVEIVRNLLSLEDADVDSRRQVSYLTPLMLALSYHSPPEADKYNIINTLLSLGASMDTQDVEGRTPLMFMVISGDVGLIRFLLKKKGVQAARGLVTVATRKKAMTCLHYAAALKERKIDKEKKIDLIKLLIEHGADPDKLNADKQSPRHWASNEISMVMSQLKTKIVTDGVGSDSPRQSPRNTTNEMGDEG